MTTTTVPARRVALHFEAATALAASHTSDGQTTREFHGIVAPFNVPGSTSAGRVRIRPNALTVPGDLTRIKLVDTHAKPPAAIGYATEATIQEGDAPRCPDCPGDGIHMRFRAGSTTLAAQRHTECAERLVDGFSVELDDIVVRGGWLEAGSVRNVALLPDPAWTGAVALAASDHPDVAADTPPTTPAALAANPVPVTPAAPAPQQSGDNPVSRPVPALTAATAPPGAPTGPGGGRPASPSIQTFYSALAARFTGQRTTPEMEAALSEITQSANEWTEPQQYAGELWSGVGYQRRFVPLINRAPLTSYKVVGWKWATPPQVAPYAGDKAPVPSNPAVTAPVEAEAERLAGAHNIDRKFRDFGQTSFFESYYRAMTESYAMLSDQTVPVDLLAAATDVGGSAGASLAAGLIEAILAMPDNVVPEFAIVGKDLLPSTLAVTANNKLAYLELRVVLTRRDPAVTVDGTFPLYPSTAANGTVLVGARQAATFYELDPVPIRVEAVDMVNAGVDPGVFGYYTTIINHAAALVKKSVTP